MKKFGENDVKHRQRLQTSERKNDLNSSSGLVWRKQRDSSKKAPKTRLFGGRMLWTALMRLQTKEITRSKKWEDDRCISDKSSDITTL